MSQIVDIVGRFDLSLTFERSRLVGLCASLTGNSEVAEDLAQETLLEGWRHLNELRDPEKMSPWLSGIARNLCLRWLRKYGQVRKCTDEPLSQFNCWDFAGEARFVDDFDVEIELERKELSDLLDQALALLPPETRTILIERYVQESKLSEVAAHLEMDPHATAMRIQRGKLALRHILTTAFSREIASYHPEIGDPPRGRGWEETRLWCTICGKLHLRGRHDPIKGELWLTCPACCPGPEDFLIHTDSVGILGGVKGYKPALTRAYTWSHGYYRPNLLALTVPCLTCGRPTYLQRGPSASPHLSSWHRNRHGLFHRCDACSPLNYYWESLEFLVLSLPEGRAFQKAHPRIRQLPARQVETQGRDAIVTTFESVTNCDRFVVVSALDTYEVLCIEGREK